MMLRIAVEREETGGLLFFLFFFLVFAEGRERFDVNP